MVKGLPNLVLQIDEDPRNLHMAISIRPRIPIVGCNYILTKVRYSFKASKI